MGKTKKDLTNQTFGRLVAKEIVTSISGKGNIWRCKCSCGGEKEVPAAQLLNGHTRSCGCMAKEKRAGLEIAGQRWGRLVAVRQMGYVTIEKTGKKQALWLWRCDCGNEKALPATQVKHGGTRSCGCISREHAANLRREDITGRRFGRLTAIHPTQDRDRRGGVLWALDCECGRRVYKTVNELKTGRVLSCGCYYQKTRTELAPYRKDFVESTSLSAIVGAKKLHVNNSSGHTGVYFNKRKGKWEAYISFQKIRFRLGSFSQISDAVCARKAAERKIHDPVVMEHWECLTPEKRKAFAAYLSTVDGARSLDDGEYIAEIEKD